MTTNIFESIEESILAKWACSVKPFIKFSGIVRSRLRSRLNNILAVGVAYRVFRINKMYMKWRGITRVRISSSAKLNQRGVSASRWHPGLLPGSWWPQENAAHFCCALGKGGTSWRLALKRRKNNGFIF